MPTEDAKQSRSKNTTLLDSTANVERLWRWSIKLHNSVSILMERLDYTKSLGRDIRSVLKVVGISRWLDVYEEF